MHVRGSTSSKAHWGTERSVAGLKNVTFFWARRFYLLAIAFSVVGALRVCVLVGCVLRARELWDVVPLGVVQSSPSVRWKLEQMQKMVANKLSAVVPLGRRWCGLSLSLERTRNHVSHGCSRNDIEHPHKASPPLLMRIPSEGECAKKRSAWTPPKDLRISEGDALMITFKNKYGTHLHDTLLPAELLRRVRRTPCQWTASRGASHTSRQSAGRSRIGQARGSTLHESTPRRTTHYLNQETIPYSDACQSGRVTAEDKDYDALLAFGPDATAWVTDVF